MTCEQPREEHELLHAKTLKLGEVRGSPESEQGGREKKKAKVASPDKAAGAGKTGKTVSPFKDMIQVGSPAATLASKVCVSPIEVIGPDAPEEVQLAQDVDYNSEIPVLSEESEADAEAPDVMRDVLAEASNRQEFLFSPEHLDFWMHKAAEEAAMLRASEAERSGDLKAAGLARKEARRASAAAKALQLGPFVPIEVKPPMADVAARAAPPSPPSPLPLLGDPPIPPRSVSLEIKQDESEAEANTAKEEEKLAILRQAGRAGEPEADDKDEESDGDDQETSKPTKNTKASPKGKAKAKATPKGKAKAKATPKGKAKAKATPKGKAKAKATPKGKAKAKATAKATPKASAAKSKARPLPNEEPDQIKEKGEGNPKRKKVGKPLCTPEEKQELKKNFSLHTE
eukprot:s625_g9.t1